MNGPKALVILAGLLLALILGVRITTFVDARATRTARQAADGPVATAYADLMQCLAGRALAPQERISWLVHRRVGALGAGAQPWLERCGTHAAQMRDASRANAAAPEYSRLTASLTGIVDALSHGREPVGLDGLVEQMKELALAAPAPASRVIGPPEVLLAFDARSLRPKVADVVRIADVDDASLIFETSSGMSMCSLGGPSIASRIRCEALPPQTSSLTDVRAVRVPHGSETSAQWFIARDEHASHLWHAEHGALARVGPALAAYRKDTAVVTWSPSESCDVAHGACFDLSVVGHDGANRTERLASIAGRWTQAPRMLDSVVFGLRAPSRTGGKPSPWLGVVVFDEASKPSFVQPTLPDSEQAWAGAETCQSAQGTLLRLISARTDAHAPMPPDEFFFIDARGRIDSHWSHVVTDLRAHISCEQGVVEVLSFDEGATKRGNTRQSLVSARCERGTSVCNVTTHPLSHVRERPRVVRSGEQYYLIRRASDTGGLAVRIGNLDSIGDAQDILVVDDTEHGGVQAESIRTFNDADGGVFVAFVARDNAYVVHVASDGTFSAP